ncbi:MAG: 30S ribosomal protein S5 [Thermoplasmata archaeon]
MTEDWVPKTRLGKLVKEGKIKSMSEALATRLPLREPEIVDILLPEMAEEVLDVNMVQRMTDSGRRVKFAITVVVGNGDGFVGIGRAKSREVGPGIKQAVNNAKLNLIEIKRGCGSWECGCGRPHTIPFLVKGKSGSVEVTLKPAPRGVSLAVGDVAKPILKFAGIEDAWGFSKGHTKTTVNFAYAVFNALASTAKYKIPEDVARRLKIVSGPVGYTTIKEELEEKALREEKEKGRR